MDLSSEILGRTRIPFEKSEKEAWKEISNRMRSDQPVKESKTRFLHGSARIALAASLAMLISLTAFLRLYRVTTECQPGERLSVELPDGSLADLNENTQIYVHPLWWRLSRKVYQEGEVFYQVKSGKKFTVQTAQGTTEVLGTTFTVLARNEKFTVTCHSGSVRVKNASAKRSVVLSPNERAELTLRENFEISKINVERNSPAWENRLLVFTSSPLRSVFDEIEDLFDVQIETPGKLNFVYTGSLKTDQSADKIISLICRPFNLDYEKSSESEYTVIPGKGD